MPLPFSLFYDVFILSPALRDKFHTPMARCSLFVLKVSLNTKQLTNFEINKLQIACLRYIRNNSLAILMTFLYKTVPYIVTTLDILLTIIYLTVVLKLDS